jgi:chromosome segregation ATPase
MTKINKTIRDLLAQMDKDAQELRTINDIEKKKRKSKFARPELERRDQIIDACREEIRALRGSLQNGGQAMTSTTNNLLRMEDHDLFQKGGSAFPGQKSSAFHAANDPSRPYEQEEISEEQGQRLQQLREDQRDQDRIIEQIEDGVMGLGERARAMNEQVSTQKAVIDQLENQVDATHEQLLGVNDKLKATLKELEGDGSFCMDILCVVMLLGMVALLIQLIQEKDNDDDDGDDSNSRF